MRPLDANVVTYSSSHSKRRKLGDSKLRSTLGEQGHLRIIIMERINIADSEENTRFKGSGIP